MKTPVAYETIILQLATFVGYFAILLLVAFFCTKKQKSDTDFILGNRSLNFWLTALSAHASDMSSWLFMAYPALIFTTGLFSAWAGIGLIIGMFLSWQFVAPKIRTATEQTNSLTLNAYFESRFGDTSGSIRFVAASMSIFFFTIYIASGLIGLGLLVESLFNLNYLVGISVGLAIVVTYVFAGGYRTVAYIDLVQGFFLLGVILFIPLYLLSQIGGFSPIMQAVKAQNLTTSLFPDFSGKTLWSILMPALGWGLGYFGQPHIVTKFMGIRQVSDMTKAKWLGISWQTTALSAATLLGIIGIFLFPQGLNNPEHMILEVVKTTLAPFFAGLVLCAILAATTNVMAAQLLVVASNLSEDFYKKIFRKHASPQELLRVSRISVIFIALIGFIIAFFKVSTIYKLVFYAWSGLGASFGPLVLLSLYAKNINRYGAFSGILVGGISAIAWDFLRLETLFGVPSMIAGFALSTITIQAVSFFTRKSVSVSFDNE
jgi:SSS family solute:Na+ symporter